eukprot:gene41354-46264_t
MADEEPVVAASSSPKKSPSGKKATKKASKAKKGGKKKKASKAKKGGKKKKKASKAKKAAAKNSQGDTSCNLGVSLVYSTFTSGVASCMAMCDSSRVVFLPPAPHRVTDGATDVVPVALSAVSVAVPDRCPAEVAAKWASGAAPTSACCARPAHDPGTGPWCYSGGAGGAPGTEWGHCVPPAAPSAAPSAAGRFFRMGFLGINL